MASRYRTTFKHRDRASPASRLDKGRNATMAKLRNRQLGMDFRRQHPAGPFVLDFYCPSLHLAIELDGGQHAEARNEDTDRKRDPWLADRCHVMRFWNSDAARNLAGVLEAIAAKVQDLRASQATPTRRWRADLPLSGLSGLHILEPQHGARFDVLEGFETPAHHFWPGLPVIACPSSETPHDPTWKSQRTFRMRVLLPRSLSFEPLRDCFEDRLVGLIKASARLCPVVPSRALTSCITVTAVTVAA